MSSHALSAAGDIGILLLLLLPGLLLLVLLPPPPPPLHQFPLLIGGDHAQELPLLQPVQAVPFRVLAPIWVVRVHGLAVLIIIVAASSLVVGVLALPASFVIIFFVFHAVFLNRLFFISI